MTKRRNPHTRCALLQAMCVVLLALVLSPTVEAQCSRSDVNYYLEKGFSHSQITTICGARLRGEKLPIKIVPPPKNEPTAYQELRDLLPANVVAVNPKWFAFVAKFCVRKHTCPEVFHQVYFRGLKVVGSDRQFGLFGPHRVTVRGKISRKVLADFSDMSAPARERLDKRLRSVMPRNAAHIEVRSEEDAKRTIRILEALARRAKA